MTASSILLLLLVAFIIARLTRSTKMWWTLMSVIMAGLLIGMLSRDIVGSKAEPTTTTQSISTDNNTDSVDMQSLADAVTEGTAVAYLGLQVIERTAELSDELVDKYLLNGRDSPNEIDSS